MDDAVVTVKLVVVMIISIVLLLRILNLEEILTSLSPPKPKMAKKLLGAATYDTKFNPNWTKEYSFITSVPSDPYRLIICYRQLRSFA